MAGKDNSKSKAPKPRSIPNKEGFQRASYLYQLSKASQSLLQNEPLSRIYSRSMDLTLKKQVLKLDPSIKRTVCKKCDRLQVIGQTSVLSLESEGSKAETMDIRCICGKSKRFPVGKDRDYVLFTEKNTT